MANHAWSEWSELSDGVNEGGGYRVRVRPWGEIDPDDLLADGCCTVEFEIEDEADHRGDRDVVAEGAVKWDGCMNWQAGHRGMMLHTCGPNNLGAFFAAVAKAYDLAKPMMRSADWVAPWAEAAPAPPA